MNFAFESHLPGIRSAPGPAPPLLRLMLIFYSHPALVPVSHCASAEMWFCLTSSILGVMEHAALIRGGGRGHLHFLFAILYKNLMSYNLHMEDYFQTVRASDQASNWTHVVKYF